MIPSDRYWLPLTGHWPRCDDDSSDSDCGTSAGPQWIPVRPAFCWWAAAASCWDARRARRPTRRRADDGQRRWRCCCCWCWCCRCCRRWRRVSRSSCCQWPWPTMSHHRRRRCCCCRWAQGQCGTSRICVAYGTWAWCVARESMRPRIPAELWCRRRLHRHRRRRLWPMTRWCRTSDERSRNCHNIRRRLL